MKTKSLTKKSTILLSIMTLLVLAAAIGFYLYISNKGMEIATLQAEIVSNEDTANIVSLRRDIGKMESGLLLLDEYLIDTNKAIGFIGALEQLGRTNGVDIVVKDIAVEDVITKNTGVNENGETYSEDVRSHGELTLTAQITSTWVPLMEFIVLLQNMPYNVSIEDVRITSIGGEGPVRWSANLNLMVITK